MIKIAFYDAKEYDKPSFERYGAGMRCSSGFWRL